MTDTSQGFYHGTPATVFEVAVERYLKHPHDDDRPSRVYFVALGAAIPVGEDYLCYTNQRGDEKLVKGESVLLALEEASELLQGLLLTPSDYELFYGLPGGGVSAAATYGNMGPDFKEFVTSMVVAAGSH